MARLRFPEIPGGPLSLLRQKYFVTLYPFDVFEERWSAVYSDIPNEIEVMIGYGPPLLEPFFAIGEAITTPFSSADRIT